MINTQTNLLEEYVVDGTPNMTSMDDAVGQHIRVLLEAQRTLGALDLICAQVPRGPAVRGRVLVLVLRVLLVRLLLRPLGRGSDLG